MKSYQKFMCFLHVRFLRLFVLLFLIEFSGASMKGSRGTFGFGPDTRKRLFVVTPPLPRDGGTA